MNKKPLSEGKNRHTDFDRYYESMSLPAVNFMQKTKNSFTRDTILKSACGKINQHLQFFEVVSKKKVVKPRNDCPEVVKMHWDLKYWCQEKGIRFEKEFVFSQKGRKFRFDFALPTFMLGIEYDGLNSLKSGHTTLVGYTKDTEKLNLAVSEGWTVLRYTVLNYQNVLQDIQKILNGKI